jgi:hypothetical protein
VGQQVTLAGADPAAAARVDLLLARSEAPFVSKLLGPAATECELVVKASFGGRARGWLHTGGGGFLGDEGDVTTDAALRALARRTPLTYTCVPPGSGRRMAVDRDDDGALDALDNCPVTANADQRDADGDRRGDACDPCPASRRNRCGDAR